MKLYNVSKHLDYIAVSHDKQLNVHIFGSPIKEIRSVNGNYDTCWLLDTGALWLYHTQRQNMRMHTICTGEVLGVIRGNGFTDEDILLSIDERLSNSITRIDIAVTSSRTDGSIHELTAHGIAELIRDNKCKTRLKASKHVANSEMNIETAYVGSRSSRKRLFRAYDKGINLNMQSDFLQRYELETRKNSKGIARALIAGQDIGAIIRKYVDFPESEVWIEIMGAQTAKMPHEDNIQDAHDKLQIERSKRWQWLIDSAAKTLARALFEDNLPLDSNPNAELFSQAVAESYNHLVDISRK